MSAQLTFDFDQRIPAGLGPQERRAAIILLGRRGQDRKIGAKTLACFLGVEERAARKIVEELVVKCGLFVVSTPACGGGYYVPVTLEEAQRCVLSLRSRALHILLRASRLAKSAGMNKLAGQLALSHEEAAKEVA
ncbi:MAG: hypothetical protein ACE5JS_20485 [Nitrospinota bacterium]